MVIDGHLLLDFYHARFSQDLHEPWPPSSRQEAQGAHCQKVVYFSLRSGMLNRASSHMCGSINSNQCNFFYTFSKVLHVSSHYAEIVFTNMIACDSLHKLEKGL